MFLFFFSLDWSSALVIDGGELDAGCTERGGGGVGGAEHLNT